MRVCFIMYQGNMYSGGQGVYLYYLTRELARMLLDNPTLKTV